MGDLEPEGRLERVFRILFLVFAVASSLGGLALLISALVSTDPYVAARRGLFLAAAAAMLFTGGNFFWIFVQFTRKLRSKCR